MESEMDYRRRTSGDPRYKAKAAEDELDVASNAQAQRWLQAGGREAAPPEGSINSLIAAIDAATAAGAALAALAAGAPVPAGMASIGK